MATGVEQLEALSGRRVLVVEDDFVVAEDFAAILRGAGAEVIGPVDTLPRAIRAAQECDSLHCALLDIDLQGIAVFPLAAQLQAEGIPMIFLTGAGCDAIPEELAEILCIGKPIGPRRVMEEICALIGIPSATA